jgi:hypothetical protein
LPGYTGTLWTSPAVISSCAYTGIVGLQAVSLCRAVALSRSSICVDLGLYYIDVSAQL